MIKYLFLVLGLAPQAFAVQEPSALKINCNVIETLAGDRRGRVKSKESFTLLASNPALVSLKLVKKMQLNILGGVVGTASNQKAEISVEMQDLETGTTQTSIALLKPVRSEESGDLTAIFTRKNKDSVDIVCALADKK
ncbi:MAG: hypothetical protein H7333_11635 [Bdellovibrionales bacterium]|nr:hypothetical protein [Oligoflexia bacterium]